MDIVINILTVAAVFLMGYHWTKFEDWFEEKFLGTKFSWSCGFCRAKGDKFSFTASDAKTELALKNAHIRSAHPEKENPA